MSFFTAEQVAKAEADYRAELVRRLRAGEYLTKADKKEARKLVKEGA